MMKVYKAVHERENKCKELHKEMNMNVGPTRLVQPDFYLLVDVDDLQKQVNTLENEVHRMKRVEANAVLFAIGGTIYYMIELIWRGYSSLPMVLVGGLCFLFCGSINEFLGWDMLIWKQMFICAVGITAIEFLSGYILNIVLGLGIWDYSNMPFNIIGQICLPFTVAWYILSLLAIVLDDHLRYWIFGEEKPRYKWR